MDTISEKNLMIRQVDISTAEEIYERFLKNDFPRNKRKPFRVIRRMIEKKGSGETGSAFMDTVVPYIQMFILNCSLSSMIFSQCAEKGFPQITKRFFSWQILCTEKCIRNLGFQGW